MQQSSKVVSNLLWRFAERCGAQLVSFIVTIILARLLLPEVYGTIALVSVFTNILNVFVDSGMASALIQKKNADDLDFSTIFYFNISICIILYFIMFLGAPLISYFYCDESLTPVIRVLSLTLVISGVKNVQQAYVSRTMQFKRFFFATLAGTLGAAILGILIAYLGGGVWALVMQQIFNTTIDTIILWITVKWRPKKIFSFERFKSLFSYGWKLLVSSLLDTVYTNLRSLIIGKLYTSSDLAYYNQGDRFPNVVVSNINASIDSVLLPMMSIEQDDAYSVKRMVRRAIKTSVYIMAPLMMGLAFCAEPIIRCILTEKWIECVPFVRIFCVTYMFYPINSSNLNAIKAMGRSDIFLKLEFIKKIVMIVILVSTMWFGMMAMAYSMLVSCVIGQIINSWPNRKILQYTYIEQLKDILPSIILAIIMGICVYFIQLVDLPDSLVICIQIILGATIYIGISKFLKYEEFEYLKTVIEDFLQEK